MFFRPLVSSWRARRAAPPVFLALLLVAAVARAQQDDDDDDMGAVKGGPTSGNLLADANAFENRPLIDDPWSGVNQGVLTVLPGSQFSVNEKGTTVPTVFSPSVQVGDLNGDTLPDLVVADAHGYFWFYPNSGTAKQAKFTFGEVMPIWIGDPWAPLVQNKNWQYGLEPDSNDNTVPRIHLVDYANESKLSLVAGNFAGKLFYLHNVGNRSQPNFAMPNDLNSITVPTYSQRTLWCNFLAPFLYDFTGSGRLDLLIGEGTYASNSIYLLTNKGSNGSPTYNEANTAKIIRGQGREHLNPQVVDWNHDGKPDIITGERAGYVNIFLNTTTDPSHPKFDEGAHVRLGGSETVGTLSTVAVGDLNGNKLPNLVLSSADDRILYAENTGALGAPQFGPPVPIKGDSGFPQIHKAPDIWKIGKALGIAYAQLCCTSKDVEADFTPPPGTPFKSALKFYTEPSHNKYFTTPFAPKEDTRTLVLDRRVTLNSRAHYKLSFWVRATGEVNNLNYLFSGAERVPGSSGARQIIMQNVIPASTSWTLFTDTVSFTSAIPDKKDAPNSFKFFFGFDGTGALYFDGFILEKVN